MFARQPWHLPCSVRLALSEATAPPPPSRREPESAVEIHDGFIVSIFNYCDRWCERCPLTARCRVFAMSVERAFETDHGPLTEPMAERESKAMARRVSRCEAELGVDFAEIQREVEKNPEAYSLPDIKFEHLDLEIRAQDFIDDLWRWFKERDSSQADAAESMGVLHHFGIFVAAKIHRALQGLAEEEPLQADADAYGSAKAALLGLERMREAWIQLLASGVVTEKDAAPFVTTTEWLIDEIDRLIPEARAFIRPGFDEPEEVSRLSSADL